MDTRDAITFGLGLLAYAALGLCLAATWAPPSRGGPFARWGTALRVRRVALARGLLVLALAHAALVWAWRFDGDPARALARGIPVFVSFHGALLSLLALAACARSAGPWPGRLCLLAWLLVAPSATPAPFVHAERIPGIAVLAVPVIVVTLWGLACVVAGIRRR
jgi:hypothetical protein